MPTTLHLLQLNYRLASLKHSTQRNLLFVSLFAVFVLFAALAKGAWNEYYYPAATSRCCRQTASDDDGGIHHAGLLNLYKSSLLCLAASSDVNHAQAASRDPDVSSRGVSELCFLVR